MLLGSPDAVRAFELPTVSTLLGPGDPWAVFPDSLPRLASFGAVGEFRELYHYEKGPRLQDFDLGTGAVGVLVRPGSGRWGWWGWREGRDRADFVQREVFEEKDELIVRRDGRHHALAGAFVHGRTEIRALLGWSSGTEGALDLRTAAGPCEEIRARAWLWRGETDAWQEAQGTRFYFPFPYDDWSADASLRLRPMAGARARAHAEFQRVKGRKSWPDWYNVLDVSRGRGELDLAPAACDRIGLHVFAQRSVLGLESAVESTVYARAEDFRSDHAGVELHGAPFRAGSRLARARLGLGWEGRRLASDDASYLDVWPFSIWDVFTATRFRLESIREHWNAIYGRVAWEGGAASGFGGGFDARLEWWSDGGTLRWKKRVPVLAPLFFRFDHTVETLDLAATNGAQLDAFTRVPLGRGVSVRLEGRLVVPFEWAKGGGGGGGGGGATPAPDEPSESERGGWTVRAALRGDW